MDGMLALRRAGVVAAAAALVAAAGAAVRLVGVPDAGGHTLAATAPPAQVGPSSTTVPASPSAPVATLRPTPGASARSGSSGAATPAPGTSTGASAPPTAQATASTGSTPTAPTPSAPTAADLRAALLSTTDLPGHDLRTEPTGSGVQLGTLSVCPALAAAGDGSQAEADVSFTGGQLGPDLTETLLQYNATGAGAAMGQFDRLVASCSGFTVTYHALTIVITLVSEPTARIGDATVAVRVTADLPAYGVSVQGDLVAVRHRSTVIVLTDVGYPLDTGLTADAVSAAYSKVAARW